MKRGFKNKIIEGKIVRLVPIEESDLNYIISKRNIESNKYFFNQNKDITINEQKDWYDLYIKRDNDFYYIIKSKITSLNVGMIRVYECDLLFKNGGGCFFGSIFVDKTDKTFAPYAKDAAIALIDFVFNQLKLLYIIIDAKDDNELMNKFAIKLGCKFNDEIQIRGKKYNRYILYKESYLLYKKILIDRINNYKYIDYI